MEDWKPGNSPTSTARSKVTVDLADLKPWKDVPELEHASGIGTYTASYRMESGWREGVGALLNLGVVNFAYALTIKGVRVKASQLNTTIDIGPYLAAGVNTVEVTVASTLNNRLRSLYNIDSRTVDFYGLLGTGGTTATDGLGGVVTVTPYVVRSIR